MKSSIAGIVGCVLLANSICGLSIFDHSAAGEAISPPEGWTTKSPRDEIRPEFAYLPKVGPIQTGSFVIEADDRKGLFGWWRR